MVHERRFGERWYHGKAHLPSAYALQEYIGELHSALNAAFLFTHTLDRISCAAARGMKMPYQRQLFKKPKNHLHKRSFTGILRDPTGSRAGQGISHS